MLKLKVLGNYSPNIRGLPGSCYVVEGLSKKIILDLGNGNFKKLKTILSENDLENAILILSHNHVDHSYDVIKFAKYLNKLDKKIKIYLPRKSVMYFIVLRLKKVFDVNILNEELEFFVDNYKFDFCQTFHRGESYATRISRDNKRFVYTSDMSYISRGLKAFCQDSDVVLIDSGHPKEVFHLSGYHGSTTKILNSLLAKDCNVKKILASHLKVNIAEKEYLDLFKENKKISLVKMNDAYDLI